MKTKAPWAANNLAVASPMPLLPPVTTATLPFNRFMLLFLLESALLAPRAAFFRKSFR
jgi:hypothetical protein